ncbi:MAG: anti-sigma factor, partial [Actinobacteria bacterium]|nr:anti-sigma factor [Actinomycetota bacterium]
MMDDVAARELLGAYALDACDDDEVAAVEALLARDPDARR